MGTWSGEFINFAVRARTNPASVLRDIVAQDRLLDEGLRVPKVVYFPPISGSPVWWLTGADEELDLPSHITVMIAPGAMVGARGSRGRLIIRGELQAPTAQIFPSFAPPLTGVVPVDIGLVELLNSRLEYLYPEWWGGGTGLGPDTDSKAFEEVIRVADRYADSFGRSPIVELLGRYELRRTIRLFYRERATGQRSLEWRGRTGGEDDATIVAAHNFSGSALLELGPEGGHLVCRDVRFDGKFRTRVCVRVGATEPLTSLSVLQLPHEFSRCGFRGAVDAELIVYAHAVPNAASVGDDLEVPVTRPVVDVHGSMFNVQQRPLNAPDPIPALEPRVAVWVYGPEGGSTRFFNCVFVGSAHAMIRAAAQEVVATSCRFENLLLPDSLRRAPQGVRDWRSLHAVRLEGGVDIALETMEVEGEGEYRIGGGGLFPVGTESKVPRQGLQPIGPLATLTAQDCRSSSPQFLFARRHPSQRKGRDSTVIGLHHSFDSRAIPGSPQVPPAVLWLARDGAPSGPSLQLIGCRIDRFVRTAAPMVIAPEGGDGRPTIFDYGTSTHDSVSPGNRILSTPVGRGSESFPDVFGPTQVGYVPFRR